MLVHMVIDGIDVPPHDGAEPLDRVGELLERIARGDQVALARLYDLLSPRVFGTILAVLPDRARGEEVLQETFLEVWRTASRAAPGAGGGRPWVLAIAHRRALEASAAANAELGLDAQAAVSDVAPPLTTRSTLLTRVAATPPLPGVDAAEAAAAEPGAPGRAAASDRPDAPFVEPAPTTTTIQAISRRNWTRGLLTLAGSLLVLVALGFGAVTVNEYISRSPAVVMLQRIDAAPDAKSATAEVVGGGTATAHWSESVGKAVLVSDSLPEIAADESYQLWFVRAGTSVPAGTFDPAPEDELAAVLEGDLETGDSIEVTVEPDAGPPEGEPSGDPIVEIPTD
jgi:DNA-directed RNA polymerase specialized sigma24 family protein